MAWRLRNFADRKCTECNKLFVTRTPMKMTCSDECARSRKTKKQFKARRALELAANERAAKWQKEYAARENRRNAKTKA